MMDFSIILPTRDRSDLLYRLFESIRETTFNPQKLEIILYIDKDDFKTQEVFFPQLEILKVISLPGKTMGNMTRSCYKRSQGRYIMLLNDDVIFRTKGWDIEVIQAFKKFPDEVALVYGNDLDQEESVPTFPFISRVACENLGGICPGGYRNLHIESHLFDIFKKLSKIGHQRIVYLKHVVFEHMHFAVGKTLFDHSYVKKGQVEDDILFISLDHERRFKAEKLATFLTSCWQEFKKNP